MFIKVDANGNLSVINGVHMIVCRKSGCIASIWVVPQKYITSFCPLSGTEAFFTLALRHARENRHIIVGELAQPL